MYFNEWITGVQHVAVPTNDLEKTIEFYHSLGFTTALETYNEAAKHRAVFLQLGNLIIESYSIAILKNGDQLPISRSHLQEVKRQINQFWGAHI